MDYVELYIKSLNKKRAQNTVPASTAVTNLPGLRSAKQIEAETIKKYKTEYNQTLRKVISMNRQVKSLKGKEKSDMKHRLASSLQHKEELLRKIGTYTRSEAVTGFEEVSDAQ